MTTTHRLHVWRDGLAQITPSNQPNIEGTIVVGEGNIDTLKSCLVAGCRLMKDNSGYLVNGIPEANNDDEAMDALLRFELIVQNVVNGRKAFEGLER